MVIKLNPIQKKFWADDLLKYPSVEYNDTNFYHKIEGHLSVSTLQLALRQFMIEYPPFHSVVKVVDGEPYFIVSEDDFKVPFKLIDRSSSDDSQIQIENILKALLEHPFDIKEEFPCRFYLIKNASCYYLFHMLHHVVADGGTFISYCTRLADIYNGLLSKPSDEVIIESQLPLLLDFNQAVDTIYSSHKEDNIKYWVDYLSHGNLNVPLQTSHDEDFVPQAVSYEFTLGNSLYVASMGLCQKMGVKFFRLLSTAWAVTITKFTQTHALYMDHTISLRGEKYSKLMGVFINNLPIYLSFKPDSAMIDYLNHSTRGKKNHELLLCFYSDIYPHIASSSEEMLNIGINYPWNPQNMQMSFDKCDVTPMKHFNTPIAEDLFLQVEGDKDIHCTLRHKAKFSTSYVSSIAKCFKYVMEQIIHNVNITYGEIDLVNPKDKTILISKESESVFRGKNAKNWYDLFGETAKQNPDAIAVQTATDSLTYAELNRLSDIVAAKLYQKGSLQRRIALSMPKSNEMLVAIMGILKSGNIYVPIDSNYPQERIDFILSDAGISEVLISKLTPVSFSSSVSFFIEDLINDDSSSFTEKIIKRDDVAYVIYTSGTTGTPKGIPIRHSALSVCVQSNAKAFEITSKSRVLQFANITFDQSILEIFPVLSMGGTLVLPSELERKDPKALIDFLESMHVNTAIIPPALLIVMPHITLPELKMLMIGGDVITEECMKFWCVGRKFINAYGPTESTVEVTNNVFHPDSCPIDIGTSLDGTSCYVLNSEMQLMPDYAMGELYIGGLKLTDGYINRPELNKENFVDNSFVSDEDRKQGINTRLYKSGDLVMRRADGHLIFLGRTDHQVKVNGHRIELGDIESKIRNYPLAQDAIVIVVEHAGVKQLLAYVRTANVEDFSEDRLKEYLYTCLPTYMVPAAYVILDSFPTNSSGKIDRKALPKPQLVEKERKVVPLETDTERKVAALFSSILGVNAVGRDDSFVEQGGDSMAIIMLSIRLEEMVGYRVKASDIYNHIVLKDLAAWLDGHKDGNVEATSLIDVPESVSQSDLAEDLAIVSHLQDIPLPQTLLNLYTECATSDEMCIAYNLPCMFACPQGTTPGLFAEAFNELLKKYDNLRLSFPKNADGLPCLHVNDYQTIEIPVIDISSSELVGHLNDDNKYSFDLSVYPLYRVRLYRIDRGAFYYASLIMHHTISDGYTAGLFQTAICNKIGGKSVPAPQASYMGYSDAVLQMEKSEHYSQKLDYWKQKTDAISPLQLPVIQTDLLLDMSGTTYSLDLPNSLTDKIASHCRKQSITPFVFYVSAYQLFLSKACRQTDFAIGFPFSGRHLRNYAQVAGYCVHTLPLCMMGSYGSLSLNDYLDTVQKDLVAGEDHAVALGAIESVRRNSRDIDKRQASLIQTMFSYEHQADFYKFLSHNQCTFPMALTVLFDEDGNHNCRWEYRFNRFTERDIEGWANAYMNVLQWLIENPQQPIDCVSLVSEEERAKIIKQNTIAGEATKPLPLFVDSWNAVVIDRPDGLALVSDEESLTFAQLDGYVQEVMQDLKAKSVPAGCRVAVNMHQSIACMVMILALHKMGCSYVPIDVEIPDERKKYILQDAGCYATIEDVNIKGGEAVNVSVSDICPISRRYVVEVSVPQEDGKEKPAISTAQNNEEAYVIYTSGTTGTPKGIPISTRSLAAMIHAEKERFGLTSDSRVLQFASIGFDASVTEIFTTFATGATLVLSGEERKHDPILLSEWMRTQRVSCATIPPIFLGILPHVDYPDLQTIIVGGESTAPQVMEYWAQRHRLINAYGPTENTVDATMCEVGSAEAHNDIGTPLPCVSCYVLDGHQHLLPQGMVGELYIGGLQLTSGYIHQDELNQRAFLPNPYQSAEDKALGINDRIYRSGDLVRQTPDGHFIFMGRADQQVKLRGFRIELAEIETQIVAQTGVKQAFVRVNEQDGFDDLEAYVVFERPDSTDLNTIQEALQQHLPNYMVPTRWAVVDKIPLTVNGKVDTGCLPQAYPLQGNEDIVAPVTPMEDYFLNKAKELLGIEQIGVETDLFDAGMTSLQAMILVSDVADNCQKKITFSTVYAKRTIRKILSDDTNKLIFWADEQDSHEKPIMVLFCGYPYYAPFYDAFVSYFRDDFSILVFESHHEFFLHQKEISFNLLFDCWDTALQRMLGSRKIDILTGYCMGSEEAVAFVDYMEQRHPDYKAPHLLNMEGIFYRQKGHPDQMTGNAIVDEHRRITNILTDDMPPLLCKSDMLIFMAKQASRRVYLEFEDELLDDASFEKLKGFHSDNWESWRTHYPNAPFCLLECTHWNFFTPENMSLIRQAIHDYWGY